MSRATFHIDQLYIRALVLISFLLLFSSSLRGCPLARFSRFSRARNPLPLFLRMLALLPYRVLQIVFSLRANLGSLVRESRVSRMYRDSATNLYRSEACSCSMQAFEGGNMTSLKTHASEVIQSSDRITV